MLPHIDPYKNNYENCRIILAPVKLKMFNKNEIVSLYSSVELAMSGAWSGNVFTSQIQKPKPDRKMPLKHNCRTI